MALQIILLRKAMIAMRAFEWPKLLVDLLMMLSQVCSLAKCNTAVRTHEGPIPRMRPQVVEEFALVLDKTTATLMILAVE